ncbi:MAG: hypothetical protein B9J98_07315 [Candidatus Terraquivivens tikiterensis]|uniref:Uncharacterized protein n=1 Tax=Candidatus Terraquivivens tikiterensis TaxID=1980982 RepID=A0A2R7Y0Y3_9ARCH|nr:MAG: hypothetical protein B9J98_07315 [Candidatus Terraquivivens tikiterensis]
MDVGYDGLKFFVESIEDFARGAFLEGIDVELHRPMGGYVSYPTSYSCISYDLGRVPCNHEVFVERLKLMGYEESVKVWTYGIDTLRYGEHMGSLEDVSPESISVLVQEGSFPYSSWALPTVDQGLEPSGDPFLAKAARKDGMTEAAFLVLPDLLEFVRKHGTPVPQLYQRALRGYTFSGLKVAKWVAKDADALLASLSKLTHSTGLCGLKRVEIAGVHDSLYDVKSALAEANFKPVCCTTILSKELA